MFFSVEIISSREEMFGSQTAKPNPVDTLRQKKAAYVEVRMPEKSDTLPQKKAAYVEVRMPE